MKHIKHLLIKTKKQVYSSLIGNNTSKFKGDGYDFVELREYENGEDTKKIDWIISAKMQKPFVKIFYTQRELDINIIPILSGSLHFGTSKFKSDIVLEVSALLGYIATANLDSYSSFIANQTLIQNTKKTKKLLGVEAMIQKFANYNLLGKRVDCKQILYGINKFIRRKSLIFLIGDFFDFDVKILDILSKKHEIVAIIVRDKIEENPIALGNINLIDPQTNSLFEGELDEAIVQSYKQKVIKQDAVLIKNFKKNNISYIKIYTHEQPYKKLFQLYGK
jgi:uncharacterized protein (DUF58 family)